MEQVDADNWQVLCGRARRSLNLRNVEYHQYSPGGSLAQREHYDGGSLITMDIMLSEPGLDFEGGMFVAPLADGTLERPEFCKGDAVLFISHKYHNIEQITAGKRTVIIAELWEGAEKECGHRCQDLGKWRTRKWCEDPEQPY
jgi:predicted 2-oxoglutarate/Fe(II)-dependent dioxygenase YbiX